MTSENGLILSDPKSILEETTSMTENIYQSKQTDPGNIAFARFWNLKDLAKQGWHCGDDTRLSLMWYGFDSRTRRHEWVEFVLVLLSASGVFLRVLR